MTTKINLLPWRKELIFKQTRFFKKQLFIVSVVTVIILVSWHLMLWQQINIATKQINHTQQQLLLLEQQLPDKDNAKQQQQQIQQEISKITNLEQKHISLIRFFENLHQGMVANAQITQLAIKNDGIKLSGKSGSMFGITQLLKSFSENKCCATPIIQNINRQEDEYSFILSLSCG